MTISTPSSAATAAWSDRFLAAREVQAILQAAFEFGFAEDELGRALGATERSIRRWRTGESDRHRPHPSQRRRRADDLRAVVAFLLQQGLSDEAVIVGWLSGRHEELGWQAPVDCLREGEFSAVLRLAEKFVDVPR